MNSPGKSDEGRRAQIVEEPPGTIDAAAADVAGDGDSRQPPPEQTPARAAGGASVSDFEIVQHYFDVATERIGLPDDIAQLVRFLCSPQSSYINGACLVCDGGFLVGGTPR